MEWISMASFVIIANTGDTTASQVQSHITSGATPYAPQNI